MGFNLIIKQKILKKCRYLTRGSLLDDVSKMEKLTSKDFYVIIRSANERTLPLCQKSVETLGVDYEVINIQPFWKAVIATFEIGIDRGRRFSIGLDADIILYENAVDTFIRGITNMPGYWKYDFGLKDRFYPERISGVHVYDTKILPRALENYPKNIERIPKPERQFVRELRKKRYKDTNVPDIVGKHGYYQYYKDIFNRFLHRAVRNPNHKDIIFGNVDNIVDDPEFLMAYLGWQEGESFNRRYRLKRKIKRLLLGKKARTELFFPKDSEQQKDIQEYLKKYGLCELEPLDLNEITDSNSAEDIKRTKNNAT